MKNDETYMKKALELAEKGRGFTKTNPVVGAVIVKNGRIIGAGYHKRFGGPHAEVNAIRKTGRLIKDATMYVTLEPCSYFHGKKTLACTRTIIRSGIKKVVIAIKDPNPEISGRGIKELLKNKIKVKVGILEYEAKRINEAYIKYITTRMPFVISKMAVTLDGKIATLTGDSRWLSNDLSRKLVHKIRSKVDAVLTGINTILKDNPQLNVRLVRGREPIKIIVDEKCNIPLKSKVLKFGSLVYIATTKSAPENKIKKLRKLNVNMLLCKTNNGVVDLKDLLGRLPQYGICSIMVEGGSGIVTSLIKEKLIDKIMWFVSSKLIGGDGLNVVGKLGIRKIKDSLNIKDISAKKLGDNVLIEGKM